MAIMSKNLDLTVAVIAKECLPGRVKTRLSPPLSPASAAGLAQLSLTRTLETARLIPARHRWLVMDGTPSMADARGFDVVPQAGGGLDNRLAAICDAAAGPLLIIGMDTPQFSVDHLQPLLQDWSADTPVHQAWLGPAADGGFWALGLRRPQGDLLRGVPMSTGSTGAAQLARLAAAGLRVGTLAELTDMDHFSDAVDIAALLPGTAFAFAVQRAAQGAGSPHETSGVRL